MKRRGTGPMVAGKHYTWRIYPEDRLPATTAQFRAAEDLIRHGMCAAPGCAQVLTANPWQCGARRLAFGKQPAIDESVKVCSEVCARSWIRAHAAAWEAANQRRTFWQRFAGRAA